MRYGQHLAMLILITENPQKTQNPSSLSFFKFGFNLQKTENPVKPTGLTFTKNPGFSTMVCLSVCL